MEEELVDDLVVFAKGIHTSVSFTKKGPCLYEIRDRCVHLQAQHGNGVLPELIVIDGPLQQPLNDYLAETGKNETWSMPALGAQSELRAIPKAARVSFPKLNLSDRIESMEIAVSEAQCRRQHAQTALAAASAMPPRPKDSGRSPMRPRGSPCPRFPSRSISRERSVGDLVGVSFVEPASMSARSVTPPQSRPPPPLPLLVNRTCSTGALPDHPRGSSPAPRLQVPSPQTSARSPSPVRMRSAATGSPVPKFQVSSPMASARSTSPVKMHSASPLRPPRPSIGQNRYAFFPDPNASVNINTLPADGDAATTQASDAERSLGLPNLPPIQHTFEAPVLTETALNVAEVCSPTAAPTDGDNASSDTTTPPSCDSMDSSTCSQVAGSTEAVQNVKDANQNPPKDRSNGVNMAFSSPMPPAGRILEVKADLQQRFLSLPIQQNLVPQMAACPPPRMQSTDVSVLHGQAIAPNPHEQICAPMQTPVPQWSHRQVANSYQPPILEYQHNRGGAVTPMAPRSATPQQRAATPQRLPSAEVSQIMRSLTPQRLPSADVSQLPHHLFYTASVQVHMDASQVPPPNVGTHAPSAVNLSSVLGAFGPPVSPRQRDGSSVVSAPLPATDTFLVAPAPPLAPNDATAASAMVHPSLGRPPLSAPPPPTQQSLGPPPSRAVIPGFASPMVRRFHSRGRSPGPSRNSPPASAHVQQGSANAFLVQRTCSRGPSPLAPAAAFGTAVV